MAVQPTTPYPTAARVLKRARSYVNDMYRGGKGRILTDVSPISLEYLNGALEELQDKIGNNGVITLIHDNVVVGPIPAVISNNPRLQIRLTYQGLFMGDKFLPEPKLPQNCVAVISVSERQVGSGLPFQPMGQPQLGVQSAYQGASLGEWEYRQDAIVMLGSTITEELRLRYESRFLAIEDNANLADTQISILCSTNSLAMLVATLYAFARGGVQAADAQTRADRYMRYIVRRYTRRDQEVPRHRQPYGDQDTLAAGGVALPW